MKPLKQQVRLARDRLPAPSKALTGCQVSHAPRGLSHTLEMVPDRTRPDLPDTEELSSVGLTCVVTVAITWDMYSTEPGIDGTREM